MKVEGVCKVYSDIGMEYRYGEFYIDRDYLVFEQNYSYQIGKRHTYPLKSLRNIVLIPKNRQLCLTFASENFCFEISGTEKMLLPLYNELRNLNGHTANRDKTARKRTKYTTHHQYYFAK
ncbi:putative RpiR family transcriptional regulator [Listeria floridensis FSL S10-1187]|uniref:RpiR family transcriptional regulator n=1 Tax=Listeria floridensis FSL S10-1187 TaxID=1265817 RepID=A0ABN0RDG9_9LIST|nr:hypothetical protein [Listeria floridensis]EUJ28864.1 putative RpiR family transcriptional regulator [Listeria floridensis FSL S10-1187]